MNSEILQQQFNGWVPITPEKSFTTSTTSFECGRNTGFCSYSEVLGWVNNGGNFQGENQFGFIQHDAATLSHPGMEQNPKTKRRKLGFDLNKKPGEKRKNKYYWAKIDVKKPKTPKPKTPKPKTPKPVRKKDLKKNKEEVGSVLKQVRPETETETETSLLNCKRVLDFNGISIEEEAGKVAIENQISDATEQVSNVVEPICMSKDSSSNGNDKKQESGLRVYRRRHTCQCLRESRKIGPNVVYYLKKRRGLRKRKPIEKIKLDYSFVSKDDSSLLFPSEMKIVIDESFGCILSLFSSQMRFRKSKRSAGRLPSSRNYVSKQTSIVCDDGQSVLKQTGIVIDNHQSVSKQISIVNDETQSVLQGEILHERRLKSASCSTSRSPENKTKVTKEKVAKEKVARGPYKRKEKRKPCLVKLQDWDGKSVEQVLDSLVEYYESMNIYDDLKSIDRMSIMVRGRNFEGDGTQEPNEEDPEFCHERALLEAKMARFYSVMCHLQGPKDFVKWNGSVLDSVVGVFLTQNVSDVLSSNAYMELASRYPIKQQQTNEDEESCGRDASNSSSQGSTETTMCSSYLRDPIIEHPEEESTPAEAEGSSKKEYDSALKEMLGSLPSFQGKEKKGEDADKFDWDSIRLHFVGKSSTQRTPETQDSVDWEAVRTAPIKDIANAIEKRGQHRIIGTKIQRMLDRLVEKHGTMDLEWLREVPFEIAKAYLLSFYGLGLKSVECLRLLTLGHDGFPVDVNIARIAVRLGWVPLSKLPDDIPFHLIDKYPLENDIQKYLWPRIHNVDKQKLYKIHYQMITFGKIFCMKKNPNCRACPFKNECKYYQSVLESTKMKNPRLPWVKSKKSYKKMIKDIPNPFDIKKECSNSRLMMSSTFDLSSDKSTHFSLSDMSLYFPLFRNTDPNPIIEFPSSPNNVEEVEIPDIEDLFKSELDEANDEFIVVDIGTSKQIPSNQLVKTTMLPDVCSRSSSALISIQDDYIALPKQINPVRLRTEHQVYELPYNHPLLQNLERQRGNIPYLLAIWTRGQTEKMGDNLEECSDQVEQTCSADKVLDESSTVLGTLLIPVRTAMRESFPLNGTYFQVNEVFADDETSLCPMKVPTSLIWMLEKRTLYCGSGTSAIFRGLLVEEIQRCCWEGYICTRGFNRKTRAPKPLSTRFHNRSHVKGKLQQEDEED